LLGLKGEPMNKPKLLVVEDDDGLCRQYRWAFAEHEILVAQTAEAAKAIVSREQPPVAIIDLGLPPDPDGVSEGMALLRDLLVTIPDVKVIVVTGNDEIDHALEAVAEGAFDFHQKPVNLDVLQIVIARAYALYQLQQENRRLQGRPLTSSIARIITTDANMLKVCGNIERLASNDVPVLILGESGTGKELLAHALHELGPRAGKPFIPLNCAAIPETLLESELFGYERGAFTGAVRQTLGKIEAAHRGTLFLDEIGDLPASLQVKLLRFLQDQVVERIGARRSIQVDVRIVCATNQDLTSKMQRSEFREDLYYRVNGVSVRVPALRERTGDPVLLAGYFRNKFAAELGRRVTGFSAAAMRAIAEYRWPGNVRELENKVKRAMILSAGRVIEPADLELEAPEQTVTDLDLRSARAKAEREVIQMALAQSNGVVALAAKLLGVSRPTLYALMETHHIGLGGELPAQAAKNLVQA
jgi:two-component system NtrC family response regulator